MGQSHRARPPYNITMKTLLVCSLLSLSSAAGVPFGYGLGAYGYVGLGLPYTYAAPAVTVAKPKVTEVEVPQYVYKAVEEKVELAPLCHNGFGFPVPCA